MKSYLGKNPTIAFGLGLPLLLVVVFLLASRVPNLLVPPPEYDVIYATDYGGYRNTNIQISVIDQKVRVTYQGDLEKNHQTPRIWLYSSATGAVKEIPIVMPLHPASDEPRRDINKATSLIVAVSDLENLVVDSSSIAPDGYEFSHIQDHHSRNFFGSMFYSSRYLQGSVLRKNGRTLRLPNSTGRRYTGKSHFIGWVVSR